MGACTVITAGNVLEKAIRKMPEGLGKGQGDYDCACLEWFRDMVAFGMNLKGQSSGLPLSGMLRQFWRVLL